MLEKGGVTLWGCLGGPLYPLEMVGQHANQATLLQRKAPVGSLCSFVLEPQIVRLFIKKNAHFLH